MITDEERIAKITTMLKQNKLWVSQEGWDESDRDDELVVSINYLIQAYMAGDERTWEEIPMSEKHLCSFKVKLSRVMLFMLEEGDPDDYHALCDILKDMDRVGED